MDKDNIIYILNANFCSGINFRQFFLEKLQEEITIENTFPFE